MNDKYFINVRNSDEQCVIQCRNGMTKKKKKCDLWFLFLLVDLCDFISNASIVFIFLYINQQLYN